MSGSVIPDFGKFELQLKIADFIHSPTKIFTYVSKSISYKVSPKGTFTGLHIFEDAASAGCAGAPSIPVVDAKAAAATVDPV